MDLQLIAALLLGKTIALVNKLFGSGATAAPGLYALKIDPNIVKKLSKKIKNGSIVISGTNGKTTTARLTFDILSTKYKIIHNRQGSNLVRGIASTFIKHSSIFGKLDFDLGLWEIDEATLPEAIDNLNPDKIVLLNLFRDQLDRYGEMDTLRKKWQKAISNLPQDTTLILNADDPGISYLAKFSKAKTFYFGVNDTKVNLPTIDHIADIKYCLNCSSKLVFKSLLSAHLGTYYCPNCGLKRPSPQTYARNLKFNPHFSTSATISIHHSLFSINYHLPGLYNVYNTLAAASLAINFNIGSEIIKKKISEFSTAFGRFQKTRIKDKQIITMLIKNPAGANEVLRSLALKNNLNLLVILNDNFADGKDVSWIWDTNWEILEDKTKNIFISGTRRWDMATRIKYSNFKLSKKNVYKEINYSISDSVSKLSNNDTLVILPTYTALLEVQKTLSKLGVNEKWHRQ